MAAAGIDYFVGRQSNALFGEDFNGFRAINEHNYHYFKSRVDPYKIKGDSKSGLLKFISAQNLQSTELPTKKFRHIVLECALPTFFKIELKSQSPKTTIPQITNLARATLKPNRKLCPFYYTSCISSIGTPPSSIMNAAFTFGNGINGGIRTFAPANSASRSSTI